MSLLSIFLNPLSPILLHPIEAFMSFLNRISLFMLIGVILKARSNFAPSNSQALRFPLSVIISEAKDSLSYELKGI